LVEIHLDDYKLPCDVLIISGSAIVNESMLTGESTPIIKGHISPHSLENFEAKKHKMNILFAGTKIIQRRGLNKSELKGIVLATSFNTEKGNLVRSILFPKESELKFKKDSIKYIIIMTVLCLIGYFISLPIMLMDGVETEEIILRGLDLVTCTVPPALPACIAIGISFAVERLKSKGVSCICRERVSDIGKVDMICFDKTGTLTEDHLDIHGFRPILNRSDVYLFDTFYSNCNEIVDDTYKYYKDKLNGMFSNKINKSKEVKLLYTECLACCHNIAIVNGEFLGDNLDIEMFKASKWDLTDNVENNSNYDNLVCFFNKNSF